MLRGIGSVLGSQLRSAVQTKLRCYSYESDISLKVLYSNSSLKLTSPSPPPPVNATHSPFSRLILFLFCFLQTFQREDGKFNGYIPMNKILVTYSRSTGPGGQNVNKVATKVDLRFHVQTADWIPEAVRNKMSAIVRNGNFVN